MESSNEVTCALKSLNDIEKNVRTALKKGLVAQYGINGYTNISETIDILRGELEGNLHSNHVENGGK